MMMVEFAHDQEQPCNLLPIMSGHKLLRKAVSDVTEEISKISKDLESIAELEEETITLQAECECCGLREECTKGYITRIRNSYSGKWVCGLCSEAVKERLMSRHEAIDEAVTTHANFVREFNTTTRVNPKLSFASAMRGIAKKSCEKRQTSSSKILRTSSCVPRIEM